MNVARKPTLERPTARASVTLPKELLRQARELGVGVSKAAAGGRAGEISRMRAEQWAEQHPDAVEDWSNYVRDNGMPFEDIQTRAI
jgi:post-segregation antitoxin (ccd killing protein)